MNTRPDAGAHNCEIHDSGESFARLAPVAAADDSYSAAEAAALLGISERRVRQLAAAGALDVAQPKPLRLAALSVLAERDRRGSQPRRAPETPPVNASIDPEQLRELVRAIVADIVPLALEGRDRAEQILREELAAARAEAEQLRAQLRDRTEAGNRGVTDTPAPEPTSKPKPQRRWFRRGG